MTPLFSNPWLLAYVVNSLWQVPLLLAVAALLVRVLKAGIGTQHLVWIAALLCAALVPAYAPSARVVPAVTTELTVPRSRPLDTPLPSLSESPSLPFHVELSARATRSLAGLYLACVAAALVRLVTALLLARRAVTRSAAWRPAEEQLQLLRGVAHQLGIPVPAVRVLPAQGVSPRVAGVLRPILLLPAGISHSTPVELTTIFGHELSHIARRDPALQLALYLLTLPIAYHPATYLAFERVRLTREQLCDRRAARLLPSPGVYAQALLSLTAHLLGPSRSRSSFAGLPLFDSHPRHAPAKAHLEERIMQLITPPAPASRPLSRLIRTATGAALCGSAAAVLCLLHVTPTVLAAQQAQATTLPAGQTAAFSAAAPASGPVPAPSVPVAAPTRSGDPASALVTRPQVDVSPAQSTATEPTALSTELPDNMPREFTLVMPDMDQATKSFVVAVPKIDNLAVIQDLQQQVKIMDLNGKMLDSNSPAFRQQLEDLRRQAHDLAAMTPQMKAEMLKLKEQTRQMTRDMAGHFKADDPAFQALTRQLAEQARVAALNSPELEQQIANARALASQGRALALAHHAETVQELDAASASIAEARKRTTDGAVREQLDQAQAALDRARHNQ